MDISLDVTASQSAVDMKWYHRHGSVLTSQQDLFAFHTIITFFDVHACALLLWFTSYFNSILLLILFLIKNEKQDIFVQRYMTMFW